jgi:lipid II:glycine glycyltransferase (peptidoglycan interpeptide bridge formation enzyme)
MQISSDRDSITQFFKLHAKTRRRHGLPPQPLRFFLSIYEEVIKAGHGFVVLARKGSRLVSAAIFFKFGRNALYKFGASDEAFQEYRGNNLTMWEGIKFLRELDCHRLDLGRTAVDNHGLKHFKSGWGTTEEKLNYFAYDLAHHVWKKERAGRVRFHHKFFGNMPLGVNRLAGALVYPHLD